MEEANEFVREDFVPRFNKQFGVPAREKESKFKKVPERDLDLIFCRKERRKISQTESFSYGGETYVLNEVSKFKFRSININTHVDRRQSFDIVGRPVKFIKADENVNPVNLESFKAA